MSGKGSKRRPQQISDDELAQRWAMAFGGHMSTIWNEYPEASLEDFERRCSRPGGRNFVALDALKNYRRELDSKREQEKLLRQRTEREERQMVFRKAATEAE